MWKMLDVAFLARSPRLYMRTPQATAQYGQVLRVSVARASLNSRTSATAAVGEKPSRTRLDPARVALVILRNSRRVTSAMAIPLHACRPPESIPLREGATRQPRLVAGDACLPFFVTLRATAQCSESPPGDQRRGVLVCFTFG